MVVIVAAVQIVGAAAHDLRHLAAHLLRILRRAHGVPGVLAHHSPQLLLVLLH